MTEYYSISNAHTLVKGFTGGGILVSGLLNDFGIGSFAMILLALAVLLDTFLPIRKPPYIVTGIFGALIGAFLAVISPHYGMMEAFIVFTLLLLVALYSEIVHEHYRNKDKKYKHKLIHHHV